MEQWGNEPWFLLVSLIASCIGILSSCAIIVEVSRRLHNKYIRNRKEAYLADITTREYIDWELETLKAIYPEKYCGLFTCINNRQFPVIVKSAADNIRFSPDSYRFSGFTIELPEASLNSIDRELRYTKLPQYRRFRPIVSDQVHYPNLIGYANTEILFDAKGGVRGFKAQPRPYIETVYTCHVLQYELWEAFRKKKRIAKAFHRKGISPAQLRELPLRNLIHNGEMKEETIGRGKTKHECYILRRTRNQNKKEEEKLNDIIFKGKNRSSLCDVNIAILTKTDNDSSWSIALGRRSINVATFPGYWSIVPSGSFELSEKTIIPNSKKNTYFINKVNNNANITFALFREYLEEVFNLSDYENPNGDNDMAKLKENERIKALVEACKNHEIEVAFLGTCFNLVTLRQTFSFAMVIKEGGFFKNVRHNDENAVLEFVSIKDFKELIKSEDALMVELAGTYRLLQNEDNAIWPSTDENPFLYC